MVVIVVFSSVISTFIYIQRRSICKEAAYLGLYCRRPTVVKNVGLLEVFRDFTSRLEQSKTTMAKIVVNIQILTKYFK